MSLYERLRARDALRSYVDKSLRDSQSPDEIVTSLMDAVEDIVVEAGWVKRADGSWFKPLVVARPFR